MSLITVSRARDAILKKSAPEPSRGSLIAPARSESHDDHSWEGQCPRKPWDYQITAAIPHLDTPETLATLIQLLRLQTVRPYILLLDTGSPWNTLESLEALRASDVEVHYLRAHGYRHSSAPVTTALDLAFALCRTDHLFLTHTDVFPRRRALLEDLLTLTSQEQPVVGYEMSPRSGTSGWRNVVSHTCTMLHMPTVRRIGASWSFERYWQANDTPTQTPGFPDTEQPFDRCLRRAGVFPYLIGHDRNYVRDVDDNIDHVRSLSGRRLYSSAEDSYQACLVSLQQALREARARVLAWQKESKSHGA